MSRVMTLHASALPSFRKHCWVWLISVTALLGACEEPTSIEDRWELSQPGRYATLNADCAACIVGPRVFFRGKGEPITETIEFQGTSDASYIIDIDDGASQGADGAVTLNGEVLLAPRTAMETGPRRVRKPITLKTTNQLDVRLTGKPGSVLTITLLGGVESIGATGGTVVAHGGGARVTIPPGALSSALEITVIDSDDPTAATTNQKKRVTLLPEGTTFSIDRARGRNKDGFLPGTLAFVLAFWPGGSKRPSKSIRPDLSLNSMRKLWSASSLSEAN